MLRAAGAEGIRVPAGVDMRLELWGMMLWVEIGLDKDMLLELMLTAGEPPGKEKTEVLQQAWVHQCVVTFKHQQLKNPVFYKQNFLKKTLCS